MEVEDLQLVGVTGYLLHQNRRVLTAPPLAIPDRQIDISLALDGKPAQGRIAVPSFAQADVVAEGPVWIAQPFCQVLGQMQLSRPWHSFVDLLQQGDVGVVIFQDLCDAIRSEAAIDTNRPMDVVGGQAEPHDTILSGQQAP